MLAPVHVAPFPFTTAISDRVGSALETALMRHGDAKTEFRSSVEACVQSLKRQGMTPEGVVITTKAMILFTARNARTGYREHSIQVADYFTESIVKWCVVEYFRKF
jgi:hypothetical protein